MTAFFHLRSQCKFCGGDFVLLKEITPRMEYAGKWVGMVVKRMPDPKKDLRRKRCGTLWQDCPGIGAFVTSVFFHE